MQSKPEIRIDQALHGYGRGHRELASSLELDDQSRSEMLVLSDLLGSAAVDDGKSYLTAYPLKAASRFVLARTWAAGREFRPGSVWTHSLLLDYQTLVLLPDLMRLNALFRQPQQLDLEAYAHPIMLGTQGRERADVTITQSQAKAALAKLYGPQHVDDVVLPSGPDQDNQILALALWRQMWPALRRQFAFTTAEGASLPDFGFPCALRFSKTQQYCDTSTILDIAPGFTALLDDLPAGGPTPLRTFLGRYVIESNEPRKTAVSLADFFSRLRGVDPVERLGLAEPLLAKSYLPRLARDLLADAVGNASDFDQFIFLAHTLRDVPFDIQPDVLIERAAGEPDRVGELLSAAQSDVVGSFGATLFDGLVRRIPAAYLSRAATEANRTKMAKLRPETVSHAEWWPSGDAERAHLVGILGGYAIDWATVLHVLTPTLGPQTLSALLVALDEGAEDVGAELFLRSDPSINDLLAEWFVEHPKALDKLAAKLRPITPEQLRALTQAQVRQAPPFRPYESWTALFTAAGDIVDCCAASLTIGFLVALEMQAPLGRKLGSLVLEPLFHATRMYRLGGSEARYLELSLRARGITSYAPTAIVQSALTKWPVRVPDCGVLAFVQDRELVLALARELDRREGAKVIEAARDSRHLSEAVREYLDAYLHKRESMKKAIWPFRLW